jgi:hypothetical protein
MKRPKQYDIFKLSKDVNPAVREGMTGVILEVWSRNSFEVEFVKSDGTNVEYLGEATFTIDLSFMDNTSLNSPEIIVQVVDTYSFNNEMIAFLQSQVSKFPKGTLLEDDFGNRWRVKQYVRTMGSIDHHSKIEMQESQGVFQYLLQGVEHSKAPIKGSKIKLVRSNE